MLFYCTHIENGFALLDEEESRHLLTVLRRKSGDRLQITDGKGFFYEAELAESGKRHALARILARTPAPPARLRMAIAPPSRSSVSNGFSKKPPRSASTKSRRCSAAAPNATKSAPTGWKKYWCRR